MFPFRDTPRNDGLRDVVPLYAHAQPLPFPTTRRRTSMQSQTREQQAAALEHDWSTNPRWKGVKRSYSAADVVRLRGSGQIEHSLAKRGAEKLWNLVNTEPFVNT